MQDKTIVITANGVNKTVESVLPPEIVHRLRQFEKIEFQPLTGDMLKPFLNGYAEKSGCGPLTPDEHEEFKRSLKNIKEDRISYVCSIFDFVAQLPEKRKQRLEEELKVFEEGLSHPIRATRPLKP